jgi:prepilin-type N-terminal cleavage/methylation domain-containing protein
MQPQPFQAILRQGSLLARAGKRYSRRHVHHPSSASVGSRRGLTLVEFLVAIGISSLVLLVIASFMFYSGRSFAALTNYVDLDNYSRNALDRMLREIRQADAITYYDSKNRHRLDFKVTNADGTTYGVTFQYNPLTKELTRTQGKQTEKLLKGCDHLNFAIFQRNPIGGTYDQYDTAGVATCKLVQVTWVCSRDIFGKKANTESVQSAKVVIRKV